MTKKMKPRKKRETASLEAPVKPNPRLTVHVNSRERTVSVLPPGATDHYLLIDGIAAEAWTMLDGRRTLSEIAAALSGKHGISLPAMNRSLRGFLKDLARFRLIES